MAQRGWGSCSDWAISWGALCTCGGGQKEPSCVRLWVLTTNINSWAPVYSVPCDPAGLRRMGVRDSRPQEPTGTVGLVFSSCCLCPGAGKGPGSPWASARDAVQVLFWKSWFLLPQGPKKAGRPGFPVGCHLAALVGAQLEDPGAPGPPC